MNATQQSQSPIFYVRWFPYYNRAFAWHRRWPRKRAADDAAAGQFALSDDDGGFVPLETLILVAAVISAFGVVVGLLAVS